MTHDETIFEVLQDLKSIIDYKDVMPNMEKLYQEAQILVDNKRYSHINVQDIEGNTFLHYTMEACNFDWSYKLLKQGANPFIKNAQEYTCFSTPKQYDYLYGMLEKIKSPLNLNDKFNIKTQGFCKEFKQYLFNELSQRSTEFDKPHEFKEYLKSIDLYSHENLFTLLGNSLLVGTDLKVDYFLKENSIKPYTPEENSCFLKCMTARNYKLFKFKNKEIQHQLFSQSFADNENFKDALVMVVLNVDSNILVLKDMVSILFEQNFDLQRKTGAGDETIEDFLSLREHTKNLYLKGKLSQGLEEKNNKRMLKI